MFKTPDDSQQTKRSKRVRIEPLPSQEVPFIDLSKDEDTTEIPTIEIVEDEAEENTECNQRCISPKPESLLVTESDGKLAKVVVEKELQGFREMFVWCPMHCRYICTCQGRVFDLRNNLLLQSSKAESQEASLHHVFNLEEHCARTSGSVFNYRIRNINRIFTLKRDFEIRKGVLSNSNSFFKINVLHSQPREPLQLLPQSKVKSSPEKPDVERIKTRCQTGTSNGIQSHCEPLPVDDTKMASSSPLQPKIQLIFHNNSDSSEEETEDTRSLPKYGLFCLNGHGYLPIKEYSSTKLVFQHPVIKNIFVSKKDPEEASLWLNELLKGFVSSEMQFSTSKWVVVQRGVLKISRPFNLKNLKSNNI